MIQAGLTAALARSRVVPRPEDVRGEYFRDQTAIIHSTPFRRLKHKTQVIFAPENDHICTRIEHVLHVATVAATICRGLNQAGWHLDTELAYAAGLGHDLGHAPFGHTGEAALNDCTPGGFEHELHSLRVVDDLARDGTGLNLTLGVRDAIVCHNGERLQRSLRPDPNATRPEEKREKTRLPGTWEGCAVRVADRVAYLGRDLEDALTAGFITRADLPNTIARELGRTNGEIINSMVIDVIQHSKKDEEMAFSEEKFELFRALSEFNLQRIYRHPRLTEYDGYCRKLMVELHQALCEDDRPGDEVLEAFRSFRQARRALYEREGTSMEQMATDYLAGMTDQFCLNSFKLLRLPRPIPFGKMGETV